MLQRGRRPQGKVTIRWSSNFAYAIGLLVTDGNLSTDGRHINLTSKDLEQIKNYKRILKLDCKINISLIFCEEFLTVMDMLIHIGISVGNQVLCSILALHRPLQNILSGYERLLSGYPALLVI